MNVSRLGPRDPKRPGGVMGDPHGVRSEQEGMEDGDEGSVGQVKEGLGGGRTHVDIKAREWRPLGVGGFLGLGLKTEVGVRRDRAAKGRVASSWRLRRGQARSPVHRSCPIKDGRKWTSLPLRGSNGSKQA